MDAENGLYVLFYSTLFKRLEHPQILVAMGVGGVLEPIPPGY